MRRSALLHLIAAASILSASKVSQSKVAEGHVTESREGSCTVSHKVAEGHEGAHTEPAPPRVTLDGTPATASPIETSLTLDGRAVHLRPLHEELQLTYVHNLLAPEEIDDLVRLATSRGGWARSPLKKQQSGADSMENDARNSSSCPLLWPLVYSARLPELKAAGRDDLIEELDLVSKLTKRIASLFTQTGLELTDESIEPLQLVRYQSTELFSPHHDFHEYDSDGKLGSSLQGEQRQFTVLLFGSTLAADAGGETHFPQLKLAVSPRKGDALVWANVDAEGQPNPRSLHEGRPPTEGHEKVAVNCWVADQKFSVAGRMDNAVRMGS